MRPAQQVVLHGSTRRGRGPRRPGLVDSSGNVVRTKEMLLRALEAQDRRAGFSFVEILTMCPTGRFIETAEVPDHLEDHLAAVHAPGVLKDEVDR